MLTAYYLSCSYRLETRWLHQAFAQVKFFVELHLLADDRHEYLAFLEAKEILVLVPACEFGASY